MPNLSVIIMAGGLGKRMESSIPKVLHHLQSKPMLVHVLEKAKHLNPERVYIIVGKYRRIIEETLKQFLNIDSIIFVDQPDALGTGHAIQCVRPYLLHDTNKILILSGDVPLLTSQTMLSLVTESRVSLLATIVDDPTGYGRIVKKNGSFIKIVEEKDSSEEEKKIQLINAGVYCFTSEILCNYLPLINNKNTQQEYYLTDIFELIRNGNNEEMEVVVLPKQKGTELTGVNTKEQLQALEYKLK